jgi:hypothetical protein
MQRYQMFIENGVYKVRDQQTGQVFSPGSLDTARGVQAQLTAQYALTILRSR